VKKPPIPTHDLYDKLGDIIPFDFQLMEERQQYDSREPHRHSYYEIFIFIKGGGTHEIDFVDLPIESNSVHFISPGQVHLVKRALNSHGYVIEFSREFFHLGTQNKELLYELPFFNNYVEKPLIHIPKPDLDLFKDLFLKIQEEFGSKSPDKDEMIRSYLNALLIYCNRIFIKDKKNESQAPSAGSELVKKFRTLIEKKFMHEHSVSEYSKLLAVTPNHLNENVQKQMGKSASEFIHDRLILEAKRLLYHSEQSVNEIAYELNFEDPSYFSKFFKKHTEASPVEYRSKIREKYQI